MVASFRLSIKRTAASRPPWRDIPLQEDKRSGLVKFRTTMIRKAPRFVLCEVASVLHGVIIPEKNYKRMQERVKE